MHIMSVINNTIIPYNIHESKSLLIISPASSFTNQRMDNLIFPKQHLPPAALRTF